MWTLLLTVTLGATPGPKEAATAAYRRGDLATACRLFAQAVREQPTDASGWSDLGLCLARRGDRDSAVEAMDRAISSGDAAVRKAAYFNLGKQRLRSFGLAQLIEADEKLTDWPVPAGCDRQWSVRADSFNSCGTSYCHAGAGLWVGPRQQLESRVSDPDADYDVTTFRSTQEFCERDCWRYGTCDPCGLITRDAEGEAWPDLARGALSALVPRIRACAGRKERACLKGWAACPEVWRECANSACDTLHSEEVKDLSRPEAALRAQIRRCIADCATSCEQHNFSEQDFQGCALVSVNACAGAVGLICPGRAGLKAEEVLIHPPAAPDAGTK